MGENPWTNFIQSYINNVPQGPVSDDYLSQERPPAWTEIDGVPAYITWVWSYENQRWEGKVYVGTTVSIYTAEQNAETLEWTISLIETKSTEPKRQPYPAKEGYHNDYYSGVAVWVKDNWTIDDDWTRYFWKEYTEKTRWKYFLIRSYIKKLSSVPFAGDINLISQADAQNLVLQSLSKMLIFKDTKPKEVKDDEQYHNLKVSEFLEKIGKGFKLPEYSTQDLTRDVQEGLEKAGEWIGEQWKEAGKAFDEGIKDFWGHSNKPKESDWKKASKQNTKALEKFFGVGKKKKKKKKKKGWW